VPTRRTAKGTITAAADLHGSTHAAHEPTHAAAHAAHAEHAATAHTAKLLLRLVLLRTTALPRDNGTHALTWVRSRRALKATHRSTTDGHEMVRPTWLR
jgi:hypothetical protein